MLICFLLLSAKSAFNQRKSAVQINFAFIPFIPFIPVNYAFAF